jgi:hypothetical protein
MRRILYQRRPRCGDAYLRHGRTKARGLGRGSPGAIYGMKVNFARPVGTLPHGQNGDALRGRALARMTT